VKIQQESPMTPLKGMARLTALLFHYIAREAAETLGDEQGRALVSSAIYKLGRDRGRRIRERVDAAGLEPTLDNMTKYYDLPIGEGWDATMEPTDEGMVETVSYCPLAEVWQELGAEELDMLYCDIDMGIIEGYNPEIEIARTESLLQSDGRCIYKFTVPKKA
jgi:predicted ArsR family transcriptional regulator